MKMHCSIRSVNKYDDDGVYGRNGKNHPVNLSADEFEITAAYGGGIKIRTPNPYSDGKIRRYLQLRIPPKELRKIIEVFNQQQRRRKVD